MRDTPRTDHESGCRHHVDADFARQLERELAEAKERELFLLSEFQKLSSQWRDLLSERDALAAKLAAIPVSAEEANELQDILRTLTNSGTALKTSARELVAKLDFTTRERDEAVLLNAEYEAKLAEAQKDTECLQWRPFCRVVIEGDEHGWIILDGCGCVLSRADTLHEAIDAARKEQP